MSFRLACELSNKIAAIASVTGSVVPGRLQLCDPDRSVPVLAIHGTADEVVPYDGGLLSLPVEQVMEFWQTHNDCDSDPAVYEFPDINTNDKSTAVSYLYDDCRDESEVELIKIIGGGHTWPGSTVNNGVVNRDINASVEIWRFFRRFSLSQVSSSYDTFTDTSTVKIYPNPSHNIIYLEGVKSHETISITDLNGNILMIPESAKHNTKQNISIEYFNPGLYFVRLSSDNSTKFFKFVKF